MAFIKNGDAEPILGHFDCDGKEQVCPKCGDKMITIAIEGNNNKLVCEACDLNEETIQND